ncbi:hypothetical protein FHS89_000476 [Rubricella aquisinus]|uniref:Pyruvate, phosphate dikinase regulatory protein n=1 Tax=Rubricella aquisinus TaxID=2028108 RepID=A0A840WH78_9RHOB|nr:pyruvate, water dikinase regulatory protein [Rubricella aquisinus]MBB5514478.1 hypothetical protein [Rubricella aquisinus]
MASKFDIHILSDSTGETGFAAVRAALALFDDKPFTQHRHVFIRSTSQLEAILAGLPPTPCLIVYTLADPALIGLLEDEAGRRNITLVPLLNPLIDAVADLTDQVPNPRSGNQHTVDDQYLERVNAIDFAMSHDDGISADYLLSADVILVGVSRTSKTPTCIYLAYQGVKAANVPLVPGQPQPPALLEAIRAGAAVIGLIATPNRLAQVRKNRLKTLGGTHQVDYADLATIQEEVAEARLFFDRHSLPVIDVTRRSIEETAAAVQLEMRKKAAKP